MWNRNRSSSIPSWPYKPVTSRARLERRKGNGPLRLFVDLEGYDRVVTFRVIQEKLREWIFKHKGYCIIIGGARFRSSSSCTSKYFVRCFGIASFRGNNSQDCMINVLGNLFLIFLGEDRTSELFSRLLEYIASASRCHRPHTDGKL